MIWVDVKGYEGSYQVTKGGLVRSLPRMRKSKGGGVQRQPGKLLKPGHLRTGYCVVNLCRDGKAKAQYVHRVVWQVFKGEIPSHLEINHRNGNKEDNRLQNLQLCTHAENIQHAIDTGLNKICFSGARNPGAKLTAKKVRWARREFKKGTPQRKIAKHLNITFQNIHRIVRRQTWRHVT